mmetsp:Transcript_3738/g.11773  ORF Transcript_3738/g.11773 Transcript_3738/m.11773 type:complete len:362 (-) Transcript_3738:1542-2627(-)
MQVRQSARQIARACHKRGQLRRRTLADQALHMSLHHAIHHGCPLRVLARRALRPAGQHCQSCRRVRHIRSLEVTPRLLQMRPQRRRQRRISPASTASHTAVLCLRQEHAAQRARRVRQPLRLGHVQRLCGRLHHGAQQPAVYARRQRARAPQHGRAVGDVAQQLRSSAPHERVARVLRRQDERQRVRGRHPAHAHAITTQRLRVGRQLGVAHVSASQRDAHHLRVHHARRCSVPATAVTASICTSAGASHLALLLLLRACVRDLDCRRLRTQRVAHRLQLPKGGVRHARRRVHVQARSHAHAPRREEQRVAVRAQLAQGEQHHARRQARHAAVHLHGDHVSVRRLALPIALSTTQQAAEVL